MDIWVVAAATGAGYIAKYWQNIAGEKEPLLDSSSSNSIYWRSDSLEDWLNHIREKTHPFNKLAKKRLFKSDSTSNYDHVFWENLGNYEEHNIASLSSLALKSFDNGHFVENLDGFDNMSTEFSKNKTRYYRRLKMSRSFKGRDHRGYVIKPLNSLENHVMGHDHIAEPKIEGHVFGELFGLRFYDGGDEVKIKDEKLLEASSSTEMALKSKGSNCKGQFSSSGPPNGMLLFLVGITLGIISTTGTNETEVNKLSNILEQTESLVRDLHEQLEMKDMLDLNDLNNRNISLLDSDSKHDTGRPSESKEVEHNADFMSEIEAELEVELERLELNMKGSSLERISHSIELNPDFESDLVEGELKLDAETQPIEPSESNIQTSNYAVSPVELSLRLHELIESKLEARIKELEMMIIERGLLKNEESSSSTSDCNLDISW